MFFIFFLLPFIILFFVIVVLAPMPGRIAKKHNHPCAKAIRMCGWTAILSSSASAWVLALMWAYKEPGESPIDIEETIKSYIKKDKRRRRLS